MSSPQRLSDYGDEVACPAPFQLDRLDHRSHPNGGVYWRLSIKGHVIGYTMTEALDISIDDLFEQLFNERAQTTDAWEQEPVALVRRRNNSGSVEAMFLHSRDAQEFIARSAFPKSFHMTTLSGQEIIGVTGHGHRILEKLRDHGRFG